MFVAQHWAVTVGVEEAVLVAPGDDLANFDSSRMLIVVRRLCAATVPPPRAVWRTIRGALIAPWPRHQRKRQSEGPGSGAKHLLAHLFTTVEWELVKQATVGT